MCKIKKRILLYCIFILFLLTSCSSLNDAVVVKNGNINDYKYVIINPTETVKTTYGAGTTGTYSGFYYSATETKTVNPKDVIAGYLIKKGFIILSDVDEKLKNQTMIITYGESNRHSHGLGYAIEVTLQFISSDTKELICTSTADGYGETEADNIRIALTRALDALFEQN
ncbi:MAG: hypothetical protein P1P64_06190 [Treponemataceae bacterium]